MITSEKLYLKRFGEAIRDLRKARGVSQEKLGFLSNLDRTYIGGIERGERNISLTKIVKLAAVFGIQPSEIFKKIEEQKVARTN